MSSFPADITFDVRVSVPIEFLTETVEAMEEFFHDRDIDYAYPAGDSLPYEHTLPGFEDE